jgi:hypothetical protein
MHSLNGISIPAGCRWIDEFDWSPVVTDQAYSITGALLLDSAQRLAGRPITLQASEDRGWLGMTRTVLQQLHALTETPGAQYALQLDDGRSFTVVFRPGEEPISARPLGDNESPPDDWPYIITLRLTEI